MTANVVQVEANKLLDASISGTAYTTHPTPINLRLMTTTPTNTTAGTEVTNAGGSTYAAIDTTTSSKWAAASAGSKATNAAITFTNMPAVTTTALELWDSTGTPLRTWWGPLTVPKATGLGDTLTFPSGSIVATLA
jgi:hypothetical protein